MKSKSINITTQNRELYEKFSMLNLVSEVVLSNANMKNLGKIIKNINKEAEIIETRILSEGLVLVKKKRPLKLNMYFKLK